MSRHLERPPPQMETPARGSGAGAEERKEDNSSAHDAGARRRAQVDRAELVRAAVDFAQTVLQHAGKTEQLRNAGSIRVASVDDLDIGLTTPFSRVQTGKGDYSYTITVRDRRRNRRSPTVLDVGWNASKAWADPQRVFKVVSAGDWFDRLARAAGPRAGPHEPLIPPEGTTTISMMSRKHEQPPTAAR